jgi:DNA-binding MarR family transcriptional regulator
MTAPLSTLQAHILGVLHNAGECSPAELTRHLRVDGNRLGAPLRGLEMRGLVGRTYSTHMAVRDGGHAYVITAEGAAAVHRLFNDAIREPEGE